MIQECGSSEPLRISRSTHAAATEPFIRQLQCQLQRSPHVELRSVRVQEQDGIVRLEGYVTSFYAKQMAQTLVGSAGRSVQIENAIVVA